MPFQSTVNVNLGFGIPGEVIFDGPTRSDSMLINSGVSLTGQTNTVGYVFTKDAQTNTARVGGVIGTGAASVTGSVATNVLTVTAVTSGLIQPGMVISGTSVTSGSTVLAVLTGAGGVGTYLLDRTSTATSTAITGTGNGSVFAGILSNPKAYAAVGTLAGGTLAPTLNLPDNYQGEFLHMGTVVLALASGNAAIGDLLQFNAATGAITAVSPGSSASTNNILVPNGIVTRYQQTGAGLIVGRLTN